MSDGKDTLDLSALGAAVPNAAGSSASPAPTSLLLLFAGCEVVSVSLLVVSIPLPTSLLLLFAGCENTLQGLAARHTDVLESLEPKVRKRVEALREIHFRADV
ncbi:Nucleosome assembly protein 1-like 1 [Hordeum vulgare]|nr:Nucleosome assembly protein 1-like 1 [Hordeum vulgare]